MTRETDRPSASEVPALVVRLPDGRVLRFSQPFYIGRDRKCDVQVDDVHASRRHAMVSIEGGQWCLRDLQSSNGTFVGGRRVETAPIGEGLVVGLGSDGPSLRLEHEPPGGTSPEHDEAAPDDSVALDRYAKRYFAAGADDKVGGRTLMIRRAFQRVQQQQRRRQRWIVGVVAAATLCAAGYAYHRYRHIQEQMREQEAAVENLFYAMKSLDVRIAELEQKIAQSVNAPGQQLVAKYMEERRRMESHYEQSVTRMIERRLNEKERLILRVTRNLGECELAAPPEYTREVARYIQKWQSTGRFARAVKLARERGYTQKIVARLAAQDLPPQYFYLAMQESDFEPSRSGPPTRWGIAKGMWQFIPETGSRYGLRIGPLAASAQVDPADDRLDWEKATDAAARYIKDIYATDAQASGLLVMASYNWGEYRVIDLLRKMPANPRERNFWTLLEKYGNRLPFQTYDYVFHIVSAAVIGENPRLFGFPFDNPLLSPDQGKR